MIHPEILALAAFFAVSLIGACALFARLNEPAPGDHDHADQ